ncbi:MAG: hypothetical protein KBS55_00825 [Bacteroidales bacterium]|nr:hypothetical protein [Candidatus Cryptobacteroides aphodequi]
MNNMNIILFAATLMAASCTQFNNAYEPLENNGNKKQPDESSLTVYPLADDGEGVPVSTVYKVRVSQKTGTKQDSPVYCSACPAYQLGYENMTATDKFPLDIFAGRSISWTDFSFTGEVKVEVTVLDTELVPMEGEVRVIPSRYGITPEVSGNVISFTMTEPGQCSVEIGQNGYKNGLMIFANPSETDAPAQDDESYFYADHATASTLASVPARYSGIYFKAGVHDIGLYNIPSHISSVYFEGGSYVYGSLRMESHPDVHIFGRGVLSQGRMNYREAHCIEAVTGSDRIKLEGITVANNKYFSVRLVGEQNTVKWTKVIGGWTYNADGISAYANSTVSNCFIWANDDNIKCYETGVKFNDIVCWQLNNGGLIQMNWGNGKCDKAEIKRVDILHGEWNKEEKNRGVLSCVGNKYYYERGGFYVDYYGWSKNWLVEDVVTETPVSLVFMVAPYNYTPLTIDGLVLKDWNISYDKTFSNHIEGLSETSKIKGLVFDNVVVNGVKLSEANYISTLRLISSNVDNPTFK